MRYTRPKSLLLAIFCCTAVPAHAGNDAIAAFDAAVSNYEGQLKAEHVVGGSVALIGPNDLFVERNFGLADLDAGNAVDDQTLFHWASVTKVFTSVAAMQLVERGMISLDDPVVKYIPAFRHVHNPYGTAGDVTIRHLLTHSAGLRGATWPWNADNSEQAPDWQPHEPAKWSQIEAMFPMTGLEFKPGSQASYSNLGISILGRIIEIVSGDDIEVYIDKNILRPLEMTRSYFDTTPWLLVAHRTHGYRATEDGVRDLGAEVETGATHANGGLNGPVGDMTNFVRWLMNGAREGQVLKPETLARMLEPQLVFSHDDRRTISIGLGFFVVDERDASGETHRYFGHSGFQTGHRSSLYIAADGSGAFLFAANTVTKGGNPSASELRIALVDTAWPQLRRENGE